MTEPDLIIRYYRDEGDTCTGEVLLRWQDGARPAEQLHQLSKEKFNKLLSIASSELNQRTVAKVVMERTDHSNLKPYVFDNPTTELLRKDPVSVIRMLTMPHVHIDLRKPGGVFTAGYDTLAQSFGDDLYARVRAGEVECPGCGAWNKIDAEFIFKCKRKCNIQVPVRFVEKWALFKTAQLLLLGLPRYFFPRSWNKYGGWITHAALRGLYEQWKKEKRS